MAKAKPKGAHGVSIRVQLLFQVAAGDTLPQF